MWSLTGCQARTPRQRRAIWNARIRYRLQLLTSYETEYKTEYRFQRLCPNTPDMCVEAVLDHCAITMLFMPGLHRGVSVLCSNNGMLQLHNKYVHFNTRHLSALIQGRVSYKSRHIFCRDRTIGTHMNVSQAVAHRQHTEYVWLKRHASAPTFKAVPVFVCLTTSNNMHPDDHDGSNESLDWGLYFLGGNPKSGDSACTGFGRKNKKTGTLLFSSESACTGTGPSDGKCTSNADPACLQDLWHRTLRCWRRIKGSRKVSRESGGECSPFHRNATLKPKTVLPFNKCTLYCNCNNKVSQCLPSVLNSKPTRNGLCTC